MAPLMYLAKKYSITFEFLQFKLKTQNNLYTPFSPINKKLCYYSEGSCPWLAMEDLISVSTHTCLYEDMFFHHKMIVSTHCWDFP